MLHADMQDGRAFGILATLEWQAAVQVFGPGGKPTQLTAMALRHASAPAPNDTDIYFSPALGATAASRGGEALAWVDRGIEVDPLSARLHHVRGRILLAEFDNPGDAIDAFGPLGVQTNWRLRYHGVAWLEPVVADARVAARLAELDDVTARARSAVREMLARADGPGKAR